MKINFTQAQANQGTMDEFETAVATAVATEETTTTEEMVNMTNTTTAIATEEMNMVMVNTTVTEFVAFVTETKEITHKVIDAQLAALGVKAPSKATKADKAMLWFDTARASVDQEEEKLCDCHLNFDGCPECEAMELAEKVGGEYGLDVCSCSEERKYGATVDGVFTCSECMTSAAGETPVAETKLEEETDMTRTLPYNVLSGNMDALEKSKHLKKGENILSKGAHKYENPAIKDMEDYLLATADRYNRKLGRYNVVVEGIEFFDNGDRRKRWDRIGAMTIRVPRGYATISEWNQEERQFVWHDFADFDFDQLTKQNRFAPLVEGSGLLTMAIKDVEFEGGLYVRMPMSPGKEDGTFFPVLKTSDIRFGLPHSENNRNLEAAMSAFLRVFTSEFKKGNPLNRYNIKPGCLTCRYAQVLGTQDGVNDDLETTNSSRVLQQNDIPTLVGWGQRTPIVHCTVFNEFKDFDGILAANKADANDMTNTTVYDVEEGEDRYLRKGELFIDGKIVKSEDLRLEVTREDAEDCDHYHGNVAKGEKRAAKDRIDSGNPYSSAYWTDRAEVNRQVVQTKVNGDWVNAFPGEVEDPEEFRVMGLGGVMVTGTADIMAAANGEFVPEREEHDNVRGELLKKVDQIFFAAFNFKKLTDDQAEMVLTMAANRPDTDDKYVLGRWDAGCEYLAQTMIRIAENDKVAERPAFAIRFIEGSKPKGKEGKMISADLLLDETKWKDENGLLQADFAGNSLGYKDLAENPKEAIKFLDEVVSDELVWDVLLDDTTYYITARSPKEKKIVAGALQAMLEQRVSSFLYDIRREEEPMHALMNFGVSDAVKMYVTAVLGQK